MEGSCEFICLYVHKTALLQICYTKILTSTNYRILYLSQALSGPTRIISGLLSLNSTAFDVHLLGKNVGNARKFVYSKCNIIYMGREALQTDFRIKILCWYESTNIISAKVYLDVVSFEKSAFF